MQQSAHFVRAQMHTLFAVQTLYLALSMFRVVLVVQVVGKSCPFGFSAHLSQLTVRHGQPPIADSKQMILNSPKCGAHII